MFRYSMLFSCLFIAGCFQSETADQPPQEKPSSQSEVSTSTISSTGNISYKGEIWVDNWFEAFVNGEPLITDSTPYKTERSFNAEIFEFQATPPFLLAFEFRDFMENETGLEYIGSRRQQLGDGGAIAQITNTQTDTLVAVTDNQMRCLTVQHAPVDMSCESQEDPQVDQGVCAQRRTEFPIGWKTPDFDDSSWQQASTFSHSDVRPKDGYDRISWSSKAKFVWGSDLKRDNIILCRMQVR